LRAGEWVAHYRRSRCRRCWPGVRLSLLHRHHPRPRSQAWPRPRLRALPRPQVRRPRQAPPPEPSSSRSWVFSKCSAIRSPMTSTRLRRSVRLSRSPVRPFLHRHHPRPRNQARGALFLRLRVLPRPQVPRPRRAPPPNLSSSHSCIISRRSAIWSPMRSARLRGSVRLSRNLLLPRLLPQPLPTP
jgi:hypothetical protein